MARREDYDRHAEHRQSAPGPVRTHTVHPGETFNDSGAGYTNEFFAREFWRFVMVQQYVLRLAQTAIEYPPMQAPASFNLDAIKTEIQEKIKEHEGQ